MATVNFVFSEKFMEECIAKAPQHFLGKPLKLVARQKRVSGFIPDLIFEDEAGVIYIVEIQQATLDRYHLYKSIEYRDLLSQEKNTEIKILLFCEELEERYQKIIETHKIELKSMPRRDFINLALDVCPGIFKSHFKDHLPEENISSAPEKIFIEPLDWTDSMSSLDVVAHLSHTLGSNKATIDDIKRKYYAIMYYDLRESLFEGFKYIEENMNKPELWSDKIAKTYKKDTQIKPRIQVSPYITSKHNFSVAWRPEPYGGSSDWESWCGEHSYAYNRPNNEIMFIHNVQNLNPKIIDTWDNSVNWSDLDAIMIAWIYTTYGAILNQLKCYFDVRENNRIVLRTIEEKPKKNEIQIPRRRIIGWDIISNENRDSESKVS